MNKTKNNKYQFALLNAFAPYLTGSISIHLVKFALQLFNRVNIHRRLLTSTVIFFGIFGMAGITQAATYKVGPTANSCNGPCDFVGTTGTAIQQAINAASGISDKVWIYNGTYTIAGNRLNIDNKAGTTQNRWYFGAAPGNDYVVINADTNLAGYADGLSGAIQRGSYSGSLNFVELANFKITRQNHGPAYVVAFYGNISNLLIHDLEIESTNGRALETDLDTNTIIHNVTSRASGGYAYRNYITSNLYMHHSLLDCTNSLFCLEDADNGKANKYEYNYLIGRGGNQNMVYFKDNYAQGIPHIFAYNVVEAGGSRVFYTSFDNSLVYRGEDRVNIANNTFIGPGQGLEIGGIVEAHIHNNIFNGISTPISSTYSVRTGYSDYSFTYGNNLTDASTMISISDDKPWTNDGGNLTNTDPKFIASGNKPYPHYQLQSDSPAINTGSNSWNYFPDMYGCSQSGNIDMGAYEYHTSYTACDGGIIGRRTWAQQEATTPYCGDGSCNGTETCSNCLSDCGECPDDTPPSISNGSPNGTLTAGTTQTTMSVTTNEDATCRWSSAAGVSYSSTTNTFSTTGGTSHSTTVTGLSNGQTYNRYIRCQNSAGYANTSDYMITFSVASDPATGDLVAAYSFDEGSGTQANDSSGNSNTGTISGAAWTTSGKYGKALSFDGADDYIGLLMNGWLPDKGTLELWIKAGSFNTNPSYIFGHTTVPAFANRIQLYTDDADGWLDLGLGNSHTRATNIENLNTGQWYHIALTWNGTNYNVFVNGASKANGTYTGLTNLASSSDIGNDGNPVARNEVFNGTIDEIRIYNKVLSQSEIQSDMNTPIESDTTPPAAPTGLSVN